PGLIYLHTHMTYFWDPASGTRPLSQPRRPAGVTTVLAAENVRKTLETGVTTVRDVDESGDVDYAMRDLIAAGRDGGPEDVRRRSGHFGAARRRAQTGLRSTRRGSRRRGLRLGQGLWLTR